MKFCIKKFISWKYASRAFKIRSWNVYTTSGYEFTVIFVFAKNCQKRGGGPKKNVNFKIFGRVSVYFQVSWNKWLNKVKIAQLFDFSSKRYLRLSSPFSTLPFPAGISKQQKLTSFFQKRKKKDWSRTLFKIIYSFKTDNLFERSFRIGRNAPCICLTRAGFASQIGQN